MTEREKNRAAFPITAALLDKFRKAFGPGVRVIHARENGRELGTPERATHQEAA